MRSTGPNYIKFELETIQMMGFTFIKKKKNWYQNSPIGRTQKMTPISLEYHYSYQSYEYFNNTLIYFFQKSKFRYGLR